MQKSKLIAFVLSGVVLLGLVGWGLAALQVWGLVKFLFPALLVVIFSVVLYELMVMFLPWVYRRAAGGPGQAAPVTLTNEPSQEAPAVEPGQEAPAVEPGQEAPAVEPRHLPWVVDINFRAETVKRIKDSHKELGYAAVAYRASLKLGYEVTADDVRNDYRRKGWKWTAGTRTR